MKKLPYLACVCLVICSASLRIWFEKAYNWDMLPYLAHVLSLEGRSEEEVRSTLVKAVVEGVPTKDADKLLNGSDYRKRYLSDSECFLIQQAFYSYRKAYIFALYGLRRMGIPLIQVPFVLNQLAFWITAIVLASFLYQIDKPRLYLFELAVCLHAIVPLTESFALATPDSLSTMLGLLYLESIFRKRHVLWSMFLVISLVLTRLDMILVPLFNAAFAFFFDPKGNTRKRMWILLITAFSTYWIVSAFIIQTSWSQVFYHTFIERITSVNQLSVRLSLRDYAFTVLSNFWKFAAKFGPFGVVGVVSLTVSFRLYRTSRIQKETLLKIAEVTALSLTLACSHFVLFPDSNLRFRGLAVLCMALAGGWGAYEYVRAPKVRTDHDL